MTPMQKAAAEPRRHQGGGGRDMMVWESVGCAANARPWPVGKPWRVTRYRSHWYWGYPISPVGVFDFRWYWQANVASWFWHHVLGWSCNTWLRKAPAIKAVEGELK